MDRGAWQTTVHGVARVGHDLVTKPHSSFTGNSFHLLMPLLEQRILMCRIQDRIFVFAHES